MTVEQRLAMLERRVQPVCPYGPVITSISDMTQLMCQQRKGNYELVKVVTGWGKEGGWSQDDQRKIFRWFTHVIIRTTCGDPSNPRTNRLPQFKDVIQEIVSWVAAMGEGNTLYIEIGNEPNILHDTAYYFDFAYHVKDSALRLRSRYPQLKLIAPGLSFDPLHLSWAKDYMTIGVEAASYCDFQAIHAYESSSFFTPQTRQLETAIALYPLNTPFVLSEFGIHDRKIPQRDRELEYRRLCHTLGDQFVAASYYHISTKANNEEQKMYHVML